MYYAYPDNTNTTTTDTINPTSTTYAGFVRLAAYLVDFIIVGFALLLVKVPMWFYHMLAL